MGYEGVGGEVRWLEDILKREGERKGRVWKGKGDGKKKKGERDWR